MVGSERAPLRARRLAECPCAVDRGDHGPRLGGHERACHKDRGLRDLVWDQENILAETDSGGGTLARYTLAPELYGALVSQRRGSAIFFHHYDALGSSDPPGGRRAGRVTNASQVEQVAYRYRAFGEQTVVSGSNPNRFTWVGRSGYYRQPDSADYWIRARVYRPGPWGSVSTDARRPCRCQYAPSVSGRAPPHRP